MRLKLFSGFADFVYSWFLRLTRRLSTRQMLMVLAVIGGILAVVVIKLNRRAEARRKATKAGTPVPTPPYRPADKK